MMLARPLFGSAEMAVEDVRCGGGTGWSDAERPTRYVAVFVRRGCFRRRVEGAESLVDPTVAYFQRPGTEQLIEHPVEGGDACTAVVLSERFVAAIAGGEPDLSAAAIPVDAPLEVAHRELLAACVRGSDPFEVEERATSVVASTLARANPERVASGRPATVRARRRMVEGAREALAAHPDAGLVDVARVVAVSPHHLSRVFKAYTGDRLCRFRNRLRVSLAMERIAEGETSLARLAADLGFADHAHLTRVIRRETGSAPSTLREPLLLRLTA